MSTPSEPPPPYEAATSAPRPVASTTQQTNPTHLQVPHKTRSGIPPMSRRSMEDESRPLPTGWVRQYDGESHHQFYVDTSTSPPRSIWHHPYDDEAYMSSLTPVERERIEGLHTVPSHADIEAESSMDEDEPHSGGGGYPQELPPRQNATGGQAGDVKGVHKFGRRMKDKMTGSTHEERERSRAQREAQEAETYRRHQHIRQQMAKAAETGQPQLLGKDKNGKDVYIEPPAQYGGMGGGYGGGYPGYGGGYGYNPYQQGVYGAPNSRYIRPQQPYNRPYGYGYGGGMGMPLGLGVGGGLLLGGLMF